MMTAENNVTIDALPPLDSPYPLTPEQIANYQKNGFVLLRHVASPDEVAAYRGILHDTTMAHNRNSKPLSERDTYGKAFIRFEV